MTSLFLYFLFVRVLMVTLWKILSMGGQLGNFVVELPKPQQQAQILGTVPEKMDCNKNHFKSSKVLDHIGIFQPRYKTACYYFLNNLLIS